MADALRDGKGGLTPSGKRRVSAASALSIGAWALLQIFAPPAEVTWTPTMRVAAERMAEGIERTAAHCQAQGVSMDPALDPNGTCLVGPMYTPLFTTLGQLEAKRTALNPDLAGLLVHLFREAGVEEHHRVAVGASGSFPGLFLAALVAVEALGAEALPILSLGSSSYGATRPELHLLDLHELWRREGLVRSWPLAVSLGGGRDVGREFEEDFAETLRRQIRGRGLLLLDEPDLVANVAARMELYGPVRIFVNIGGAQANLGTSPRILEVPPGLSMELDLPPAGERGVLYAMAARGTPIVHLLHVRGLALGNGIQWDPIPLPSPGSTPLSAGASPRKVVFWSITLLYFLSLILILAGPPGIPVDGAAGPSMS